MKHILITLLLAGTACLGQNMTLRDSTTGISLVIPRAFSVRNEAIEIAPVLWSYSTSDATNPTAITVCLDTSYHYDPETTGYMLRKVCPTVAADSVQFTLKNMLKKHHEGMFYCAERQTTYAYLRCGEKSHLFNIMSSRYTRLGIIVLAVTLKPRFEYIGLQQFIQIDTSIHIEK